MVEITYNKIQKECNPKIKQLYWNIVFGLQDVNGLKLSKHIIYLSAWHVQGKKNYRKVQNEILSNKLFRFDYLTFKNYHKRLFVNLDKERYLIMFFENLLLNKNNKLNMKELYI